MTEPKPMEELAAWLDANAVIQENEAATTLQSLRAKLFHKNNADIFRQCAQAVQAASEAREAALREAQQAVVNACSACDGQGFTVTTTTGYGHACGGDERLCQTSCPVPIPEQTQDQCEYCGRPCGAIGDLISSPPPAKDVSREAGWKLVPIEPTEEMDQAARDMCHQMAGVIDPVVHVWDAMLAAAPEPPKDVEPGSSLIKCVQGYVDGYELRGDEGDHCPTEQERILIVDCIFGLLEDGDFLKIFQRGLQA